MLSDTEKRRIEAQVSRLVEQAHVSAVLGVTPEQHAAAVAQDAARAHVGGTVAEALGVELAPLPGESPKQYEARKAALEHL